ncbi:S-adenosyl-L-methionine-dependent methyltransferase [Crepidotus variabilis]|uniref:Leucine carboxyl methyltransferase 1 n=1 Tax=Crepidotus variabilis TaxID=179855 RepID=A0A9P6JRM9_9AGAR|nr:S-adenosyl-L-methionine-dependent methyltransferase [Crepidotus variabilis]
MLLPSPSTSSGDAPVRSTDNDAAAARVSAVKQGYLLDPFAKHLVPRAHLLPLRPPLINIGTYVRTAAIDSLVDQWLELAEKASQTCQIISLGAGSDTRFWRIASGKLSDGLGTYVEVDFPEITTKKAMAIKKSKDLLTTLGDPSHVSLDQGGTALRSTRYHLLPLDLRVDPEDVLKSVLATPQPNGLNLVDPSKPTLLIFECVLAYMAPELSSRLLEWFVKWSQTSPCGILGCIVYEMFGLNDAFGRVMVNNLKERSITLPGAEAYSTIESLPGRFLNTGFTAARALTLKEIRKSYIPRSELDRIAGLEFLDETEELDLVLDHYAISWGLFFVNNEIAVKWGHWGLVDRDDSDINM